MEMEFKYSGRSAVVTGLGDTRMALATNTLREAVFFGGELTRPLPVRQALEALHRVVVSDLKYTPKDREAFRAWLAEQDRKFLRTLGLKNEALRRELEEKEVRLDALNALRSEARAPFTQARREYFERIYTDAYELDYVLDPVVTVHPDEISFEAFSIDESSYARVAAKYDCFSGIDGFECGTTNIDFSDRLHGEFSRLRSYRSTRLDVGASAVSVATESHAPVREKRIQLPETWLQGFMQVHSVMTLGLRKIRLAPIDVFNICRFLRRHRAKTSPRALRWQLRPGERTVVFVEPWDARIELSPASVYDGPKEETIRTWGRDRLQVLEPLLADAERIELYLAGHGLPLVVTVDMDLVVFTLALSGWTDNDWTGQSRFSLLSRRIDVKAEPLTAVYHALREKRYATLDELTSALDRDREEIRSCLSALCQAGRAMVDLAGGVYRHRDLLLTPFSAKAVLAEQKRLEEDSDPNAKAARQTVAAGHARITSRRPVKTGFKITGSVRGTDNERVRPLLHVDPEGLILDATCTCKFFRTHRLTKGPCEHVLALRLIHMDRLGKGE